MYDLSYADNQSNTGVNTAAIKHLIKGCWPVLSTVNISVEECNWEKHNIQLDANVDLHLNCWKNIRIFWLSNLYIIICRQF